MLTVENNKVVYYRENENKKIDVYEILESDNIGFNLMDNDEIISELIENEKIWFTFDVVKTSKKPTIRDGFNCKIVYTDVTYMLMDFKNAIVLEVFEKTEEVATTHNITKFLKELEYNKNLLHDLAYEKNENTNNTEVLAGEFLYIK